MNNDDKLHLCVLAIIAVVTIVCGLVFDILIIYTQ